MLHLSTHLAYTHVKHCLGASTNGASANAAPASGFGVHQHETLEILSCQRRVCKCRAFQRISRTTLSNIEMARTPNAALSADLAYTHMKHCVGATCQRVWRILRSNIVFAQVPTERLQMLHLSADLAYINVKHCLGASTNGVSANAPPVRGFGVHPRETLLWRKCQWSVCKFCTCQRIWRTPT